MVVTGEKGPSFLLCLMSFSGAFGVHRDGKLPASITRRASHYRDSFSAYTWKAYIIHPFLWREKSQNHFSDNTAKNILAY